MDPANRPVTKTTIAPKNPPVTKAGKFEALREINPEIERLKAVFDLDLDFLPDKHNEI